MEGQCPLNHNSRGNMKSKTKINFHLIVFTVIFSIMLLISGSMITRMQQYKKDLVNTIEQRKRNDARMALRDSIERFDKAVKSGIVNPNDINSVANWARDNFAGLRNGSSTSDGFIIELGSEQFVDDQSTDCQKPEFSNGRYMKDEAKMHKDPKLAEQMLNKMRVGIATKYGDNYSWNFDGNPEWLEWDIYPPDSILGLNDEPKTIKGIKNHNYKKYLFVLGTQSDEILGSYGDVFKQIDRVINLFYIVLFLSLTSMIYKLFYLVYIELHYKPKHCTEGKN